MKSARDERKTYAIPRMEIAETALRDPFQQIVGSFVGSGIDDSAAAELEALANP
jgi:hypothetical protein